MGIGRDIAYVSALTAASPFLLVDRWRRGRLAADWSSLADRMGHAPLLPPTDARRVLLHAVSVGETNAIRGLVDALGTGPDPPEVVIASTTETGFRRALELFGETHAVVRFPVDLSAAVRRFLDAVRPDLAVMVELELWPNFVEIAAGRDVPVAVVNGRLSARSFARYARVRSLLRRTFERVALAAVQTPEYAERFAALGTPRDHVVVTDTMKWDTARIEDDVDGADALADELGIDRSRPLIVGGSTTPEEHRLLVAATPPDAQLLCAPRRPEWFDDAAGVLTGCARRSRGDRGSDTGRFLLDTFGELRCAYALADIAVVGRSFVDLGGSDMIEPVGLGKATIVGPHVSAFADTADALADGGGLLRCAADALAPTLRSLLEDDARRNEIATAGRAVIRARQGATERTAALLRSLIVASSGDRRSSNDARSSASARDATSGATS